MSLRILGGEFKGRILCSPKTDATRPTLAVMKQAVFNILQTTIEGADVLDLYAGSGAMGLEALSRGAKSATFVESDKHAFHCIKENVKLLKVENRCTLVSYDVVVALKKWVKTQAAFDMIYADPPYAPAAKLKLLEELLGIMDGSTLIRPGGKLFLEEMAPGVLKPQELQLTTLRHVDSRSFSKSTLHQFQRLP